MKKNNLLAFAIFTILFSTSTYSFNLFGPKNFDECVLENMKNAKTEQAVSVVMYSCKNKFPDAPIKKEDGIKICYLYWDGWKLVLGNRYKHPDFKTYEIERNGVKTVEFSLPKKMAEEFKKRSKGEDKNVDEFFKQNVNTVMSLCSFN
jgi:hypothetical protein